MFPALNELFIYDGFRRNAWTDVDHCARWLHL